MNIYLADKLKSLRAEKRVSQEKLAQYLKVSFQAVSKWESGISYPDITLLPEIARFFGVSIDELLCVEKLDEKRLFDEYSNKAEDLYRSGNREGALAVWQEAYQRMPNNIDVKEMLMSSYFDTDREKYYREFCELATDIYKGNAEGKACVMYYKSQAVSQLARLFAERGDIEEARKWARRSVPVFNAQEIIEAMIDNGDDLISDASFCTYWFLEKLFFFACRIGNDDGIRLGGDYKQNCFKAAAQVFELLYQNDDMGFEQLEHLFHLHQQAAELEAAKSGDERAIEHHLRRAAACCIKSVNVKEHLLSHPLLHGRKAAGAPSDNMRILRSLAERLANPVYDPYRHTDWFEEIRAGLQTADSSSLHL